MQTAHGLMHEHNHEYFPKKEVPKTTNGLRNFFTLCNYILALLNKFFLTLGAGNAYPPLTLGHSYFLLTGRTSVKMVIPALSKMLFAPVPLNHQTISPIQVLLVLRISLLNLLGHHAIIFIHHEA